VIDPTSGEIYAMGTYPTFDPNNFSQEKVGVFSNPLVNARYEMGSIIKALTMAAGLDAGVVTAKTTYNDLGSLTMNGSTIRNYDHKGRGVIPMQEVLNQSLNTGVSFVVSKMGNAKFASYFENYGLGETTGIDLPGEIHGDIRGLKSPRDIEYATASFGQGIALTPIETARALCTLGNGGILNFPHIVKKINYDIGGSKIITASTTPVRVLKQSTSEEITRMLVVVVDKALKGGKYNNPHYSVAAKTGTAQIAVNGKYSENDFLHSFFGYFPAYNPKFLVLMYLVKPQNVSYASDTLTIPFMNMRDFLISYYNVPPDR
jgi:cell division protein FtsI/penicillin-binding protein 2